MIPEKAAGILAIISFLVIGLFTLPTVLADETTGEDTIRALQRDVARLKKEPELVRGKAIYKIACLPCHGIRGDGKGPAALGFDPSPRNFTRGVFKWRTTVSGALPTDDDLDRTIRLGVPGTEMVGWGNIFSGEERRAVIQYIKTFSPFFEDPDYQLISEDLVEIPQERPFEATPETIVAGKEIYEKQECWQCHGRTGRGDGPSAAGLVDDWDDPITPYDLTKGYIGGGGSDWDIYRTFTTGLNGTPMPAFEELTDDERWKLVDYIKSLEREKDWYYFFFVEEPTRVTNLKPDIRG